MKTLVRPQSGYCLPKWTTLLAASIALSPLILNAQQSHTSCEADEGHPCCVIRISGLFGIITDFEELGRTFPEWEAVDRSDPDYLAGKTSSVVLEGTVVGNSDRNDTEKGHVSFEDTPFGHNTHDFTFKVRPDDAYKYLLGIQVHTTCAGAMPEICPPNCALESPPTGECPPPCFLNSNGDCVADFNNTPCLVCPTSHCTQLAYGNCVENFGTATCDHFSCADLLSMGCMTTTTMQDLMEVEWECGLGASNDDNPCQSANQAGNTCGFFSAGHTRRQPIWQWPTVGDHVHVEGYWIWDRGHPPAVTEIHPPRLVATSGTCSRC